MLRLQSFNQPPPFDVDFETARLLLDVDFPDDIQPLEGRVFAWDADDTVAFHRQVIIDLFNENFDTELTLSDFTSPFRDMFAVETRPSDQQISEVYYSQMTDAVYRGLHPVADSVAAMGIVQLLGGKNIVNTARSRTFAEPTVDWFLHNTPGLVAQQDIHHARSTDDTDHHPFFKLQICKAVNAVAIADDHAGVIKAIHNSFETNTRAYHLDLYGGAATNDELRALGVPLIRSALTMVAEEVEIAFDERDRYITN